jgi:hypothetical protein
MPDPITLGAIGTVALTEGVKFLYKQAGEVLKGWREHRNSAEKGSAPPTQSQVVQINLPPVFEGQLSDPKIHFNLVERLEPQLREIRQGLSAYADDIDPIDSTDEKLMANVDALRQMLEAVYQQRITFKGEKRPPSGPTVEGKVDVEKVEGLVAAVRAGTITAGKVSGEAKAKEVAPGGTLTGVEVEKIG